MAVGGPDVKTHPKTRKAIPRREARLSDFCSFIRAWFSARELRAGLLALPVAFGEAVAMEQNYDESPNDRDTLKDRCLSVDECRNLWQLIGRMD